MLPLKLQFLNLSIFQPAGELQDLIHFVKQVASRQCGFWIGYLEICYEKKILVPDLDVIRNFIGALNLNDVHVCAIGCLVGVKLQKG